LAMGADVGLFEASSLAQFAERIARSSASATCLIASGVQFAATGFDGICGGWRVKLFTATAARTAAAMTAITRFVRGFKGLSVSVVKYCQ